MAAAGKSGTAERFSRTSNAYDDRSNLAYLASRSRAWFEVYTPAEDPQIAVVAVLEAGAWGATSAGPITRHVLDAWIAAKGRAAPPFTPFKDASLGNVSFAPEDLPAEAIPASTDQPNDQPTDQLGDPPAGDTP
jgi:penicillin-binding protein 2